MCSMRFKCFVQWFTMCAQCFGVLSERSQSISNICSLMFNIMFIGFNPSTAPSALNAFAFHDVHCNAKRLGVVVLSDLNVRV